MADDVIARAVERNEVTRDFVERAAAVMDRAFGGWPQVALRDGVTAVDHLQWKASGTGGPRRRGGRRTRRLPHRPGAAGARPR
jgi:hypothetical protein